MTNYEKIKQMSVQELARLLNDDGICSCCAYQVLDCDDCLKGHIEWLESEAETE